MLDFKKPGAEKRGSRRWGAWPKEGPACQSWPPATLACRPPGLSNLNVTLIFTAPCEVRNYLHPHFTDKLLKPREANVTVKCTQPALVLTPRHHFRWSPLHGDNSRAVGCSLEEAWCTGPAGLKHREQFQPLTTQ